MIIKVSARDSQLRDCHGKSLWQEQTFANDKKKLRANNKYFIPDSLKYRKRYKEIQPTFLFSNSAVLPYKNNFLCVEFVDTT